MGSIIRTIDELARLIDVSPSTVSRVFNNNPKISGRTRQRVLDAASEHGFKPNSRKRPVSNRELRIILVTPAPSPHIPHVMEEAMALFEGLSASFIGARRILEVVNILELAIMVENERRVGDGVVSIFNNIGEDIGKKLDRAGIPYIHLNRTEVPYVASNDFKGFTKLLHHLFDRSYARPAFLNYSGHPRSEERRTAYLAAMLVKYPGVLPVVEEAGHSGDITPDLIRSIRSRGSDALLCFNDEFALRASAAARDAGIDIPGNLAITGYDDIPAASLCHPRLTTVRLPVFQLANLAGNWLRNAIRDKEKPLIALEVTGELVVGKST
jgi:LacI family transcriptional regulator